MRTSKIVLVMESLAESRNLGLDFDLRLARHEALGLTFGNGI